MKRRIFDGWRDAKIDKILLIVSLLYSVFSLFVVVSSFLFSSTSILSEFIPSSPGNRTGSIFLIPYSHLLVFFGGVKDEFCAYATFSLAIWTFLFIDILREILKLKERTYLLKSGLFLLLLLRFLLYEEHAIANFTGFLSFMEAFLFRFLFFFYFSFRFFLEYRSSSPLRRQDMMAHAIKGTIVAVSIFAFLALVYYLGRPISMFFASIDGGEIEGYMLRVVEAESTSWAQRNFPFAYATLIVLAAEFGWMIPIWKKTPGWPELE